MTYAHGTAAVDAVVQHSAVSAKKMQCGDRRRGRTVFRELSAAASSVCDGVGLPVRIQYSLKKSIFEQMAEHSDDDTHHNTQRRGIG